MYPAYIASEQATSQTKVWKKEFVDRHDEGAILFQKSKMTSIIFVSVKVMNLRNK